MNSSRVGYRFLSPLNRNAFTMESYDKEKVQQFFQRFWSNPANATSFEADAAKRAETVNSRLVRGSVALMSNYVATEQEFEDTCKELGIQVPAFVMS